MNRNEMLFVAMDELKDDYVTEVYEDVFSKSNNRSKVRSRLNVVAAVVLLLIVLPNTSPVFAKALSNIPFIGKIVEVVTISSIEERTGNSTIDAEVPHITTDKENTVVATLNSVVETYVEELVEKFKEENGDRTSNLSIGYTIVNDSEKWFSLLVYTTEIEASARELHRYYNIDKTTGTYVTFGEFIPNFDESKEKINQYVLEEMKRQMTRDKNIVYFINAIDESGFESVTEDQAYYIDELGQLVISFDEYEIAPGYMGVVKFIIPSEVY